MPVSVMVAQYSEATYISNGLSKSCPLSSRIARFHVGDSSSTKRLGKKLHMHADRWATDMIMKMSFMISVTAYVISKYLTSRSVISEVKMRAALSTRASFTRRSNRIVRTPSAAFLPVRSEPSNGPLPTSGSMGSCTKG